MRKFKLIWLLAPLLALLRAAADASRDAGTGFVGSQHDFTTSTSGGTTITIGACTRCHTPHHAIGTRLLWNHTLSKNSSFSWGDVSETIGGTKLPTFSNTWTGPTKYCLSCHDGSVATGDVNWWNGGGPVCVSAKGCASGFSSTSSLNVAPGGNLQGNHPVAVPYPFGQVKNTYNSSTTGEGVKVTEYAADPTNDGIRLFNDAGGLSGVLAGTSPGATGLECTSCHDVHNGSTVQDIRLLRGTINGTTKPYLCAKCHLKP